MIHFYYIPENTVRNRISQYRNIKYSRRRPVNFFIFYFFFPFASYTVSVYYFFFYVSSDRTFPGPMQTSFLASHAPFAVLMILINAAIALSHPSELKVALDAISFY
jgi:hypothetical protein